jgi:crossover junction endodeoxyribonuclease RuvC
VTPQRWKKTMLDGQGKDKDAARFKAQALFPQIELHLKKHDGRADALLIAEFARRTRA